MKILSVLAALVVVNALLLAPGWVLMRGLGPSWLALESCLVVGVFALLPASRKTRALAAAVSILLVIVTLVAVGDAAARLSLARPLNLYLDVHLLRSVQSLLVGTLGQTMGIVAMLAGAVGALGLTWCLTRLLSAVSTGTQRIPSALAVGLLAVPGLGLVGPRAALAVPHVSTPGMRIAVEQIRHLSRMLGERARFDVELTGVPASYAQLPDLLSRLEQRDVVIAFIESYGMSAVDDARYAPVIGPRLEELTVRMERAGLHLASGALVAPTQGGQSWFSHGSLLSGAWLENQLRYDLLLASGRETLVDDFRRAGYRTVAVMPAITLAWPEGERLGYDTILAHDDIEYEGPPLNWVTMPDQFIWSFLERVVRTADGGGTAPLFAELGLISSHAPWTPILPVLDDWDRIGDGSVFAPWEHAGERPEDLWQDLDRVRAHYARSVDYAIHTMTAYAERYVDDRTLLIVLGDHQPAPLITGDEAGRAVPVHVISGDPALVQPFIDWGFEMGGRPSVGAPTPRMDAFRDWFVRAFSEPADGGVTSASGVPPVRH